MTSRIGLAIFLFMLCAALLVVEVFVPSGGLISVAALLCLGGGIGLGFKCGIAVGWIMVGVAVVLIPTTLIIAYRVFPRTRFGKAVTLEPPERIRGDAVPDTDSLKALMGAQGRVLTPLRPVGMCDFSGLKVECVAENGYVDTGRSVEVIRVQGSQLTVRQLVQD